MIVIKWEQKLKRAAGRITRATGCELVEWQAEDLDVQNPSIDFGAFHVDFCAFTGKPMLVITTGGQFAFHFQLKPTIKAIIEYLVANPPDVHKLERRTV